MSNTPWVKWYAADFLNGTWGLNANELAVYTIVLNLIYDASGPIKDDAALIGRRCGMRPSTCERALSALADLGKIARENGTICNDRAEKEIESRAKLSEKSSENAHARWKKRAEKPNDYNGAPDAGAMQPQCDGIKSASAYQKPEARRDTNVSLKRTQSRDAEPEGFADWWAGYPKRDGSNPRAAAAVAYGRAIKDGASPADLEAGKVAYAAECQRKSIVGTGYVAQASTWLNQRRWRDYLEKPKPQAPAALTVSDEEWREEVAYWRRTYGRWSLNHVSEPPDSPRTRVPPRILAEFGLSRAA